MAKVDPPSDGLITGRLCVLSCFSFPTRHKHQKREKASNRSLYLLQVFLFLSRGGLLLLSALQIRGTLILCLSPAEGVERPVRDAFRTLPSWHTHTHMHTHPSTLIMYVQRRASAAYMAFIWSMTTLVPYTWTTVLSRFCHPRLASHSHLPLL